MLILEKCREDWTEAFKLAEIDVLCKPRSKIDRSSKRYSGAISQPRDPDEVIVCTRIWKFDAHCMLEPFP